eukprot:gene8165-7990_t
MHSVAFATCQGNDCQVEIDANIDFDSSYYLSENHNGIFIQSNTGTNAAIVDLQNVVMRDNGNITGSAQAVGNNIAISLSSSSKVPVRHVSQSNYGDQLASVNLSQRSTSKTGEVLIEAVSIGNNFSLNLDNASLAELSVAQCNVSDNVARFDTSIADMELKYSDNKLITDNPDSKAHRQIFSGSLPGSDYHIVGGITEVNYNIRSGSLESSIRFIGAAARYFVMNVAVDLRVVNTKTLEV